MKDSEVHIGSVIKRVFDTSGMSPEDFADAIHKERSSIYHIFKKKSLDTEQLILVSKALNYEFILEYEYFRKKLHYSKKMLISFEIESDNLEDLTPQKLINLLKNKQ